MAGFVFLITIISIMLLSRQIHHNDVCQASGKIISISAHEVIIADKKGETTVLMVNEETEIHGGIETLVPGQFVYSFGTRLDNGFFESRGIKIVKNP